MFRCVLYKIYPVSRYLARDTKGRLDTYEKNYEALYFFPHQNLTKKYQVPSTLPGINSKYLNANSKQRHLARATLAATAAAATAAAATATAASLPITSPYAG